jgi:BlaI family transcriptional regulator, penicillinase repressor
MTRSSAATFRQLSVEWPRTAAPHAFSRRNAIPIARRPGRAPRAARLFSGNTNYFVDKRINSYNTRSVASRSLSKKLAPPPLPTDAEIAILAVLWRQGASTVREVHEALGKDSGYTTTLKLMQLMFEKGLVVRNERYRSHVYKARAPKEQTQRQIAGDLLKRAFEGSAKSLVLGALAAQPASGKDLAEIRSLLDEFEKRRGKK